MTDGEDIPYVAGGGGASNSILGQILIHNGKRIVIEEGFPPWKTKYIFRDLDAGGTQAWGNSLEGVFMTPTGTMISSDKSGSYTAEGTRDLPQDVWLGAGAGDGPSGVSAPDYIGAADVMPRP